MRSFSVLLLILVECQIAHASPRSARLDRAMSSVWPATATWNDALEDEYADFVFAIGDAVEDGRCSRANECLADANINPLHDEDEGDLAFNIDCADLPYVLRAYFSWKHHLPFGFVGAAQGTGTDLRSATDVTPTKWRSWREFPTPRALFRTLVDSVDSGFYRIPDSMESGDFYPVAVDRAGIRPGTIFYDPLGHVSMVARVDDDGSVWFVYGMPKGDLLLARQDAAFATGPADVGGGFKRFRTQTLTGGRITRAANAEIPGYDERTQYDELLRVVKGKPAKFHDWVRARLALAGAKPDMVSELRDDVRQICRGVRSRVEMVEAARVAGLPLRTHPGELPPNIYAAGGDWEDFASPASDTRLKIELRDLYERLAGLDDLAKLSPRLRKAWNEEASAPGCKFVYYDSTGAPVPFTIDTVLDRLFAMSFDPYTCPELRWGAPAGSVEARSCPDDAGKLGWYESEQRLRNRVERVNGRPTPLEDGPDRAPMVDVRRLLDGGERARL